MGGYYAPRPEEDENESLLNHVLTGDFSMDESGAGPYTNSPRTLPAFGASVGGGAPVSSIGATTPGNTAAVTASALPRPRYQMPQQPEMDSRYAGARSRQADAQRGVDPNDPRYKMNKWQTLGLALSAGAMAFGGDRNAAREVTAMSRQPYEDAQANQERIAKAAGTEAQGYEEDYNRAIGRYNMQMREMEANMNQDAHDLQRQEVEHDYKNEPTVKETDPATGKPIYRKYNRIGTNPVNVPEPKGETPATPQAGLMSDDPEIRKRAEDALKLEKKIKGEGKGGVSRKDQDTRDAADAKRQGRLQEIEDEIAAKQDSKGNHIRAGDEAAYRQREQRKAENEYAVEVNKAGAKYKAAQYPNWTKSAADSIRDGSATGGSQTNQSGSHTSQVKTGGAARPTGSAKPLDRATAAQYLSKAGGDKQKARALAAGDGYTF